MSIVDFSFVLFTAVVIAVYYLLPDKAKWPWLLISSVAFFVLASSWKMIPYLLYGLTVTYFGAQWIRKTEDPKKRKTVLVLTILLTLAELVALKYLNLFVIGARGFARIFSLHIGLELVSIAAPLGISYYTLSLLGYVLDVYREVTPAEPSFFRHALFACYFPQITSGPVTRYGEMKEQLFTPHAFDYETVVRGLQRGAWGLFKKMVIADRLNVIVKEVYQHYDSYSPAMVILATVCFAFELYAEFSGGMDIIMGVSEALGVRLPENFNRPFFSRTLGEFWRRWHITLGLWFKDYMLYPILKSDGLQKIGRRLKKRFGKNAGKKMTTYIGLLVLWVAIGIWHGGSMKYLFASGILQWFYIIISESVQPALARLSGRLKLDNEHGWFPWFARLRTLLLICFGFIFICADSFGTGVRTVGWILTGWNTTVFYQPDWIWLQYVLLALGLVVLFAADYMANSGIDVRMWVSKRGWYLRWPMYWALLTMIILSVNFSTKEFLYAQF